MWAHLDGWNPIAIQGFLRRHECIDDGLAETLSRFLPSMRFDHEAGLAAATLPLTKDDPERAAQPFILAAHGQTILTASKDASPFLIDLMNEWVSDPEGLGQTSEELLQTIIHSLAEGDIDQIDGLHERIESLEDSIYEMKTVDASSALCVKREILEERRRLALLRDFVAAVTRHGEPWVPKSMMAEYQDINSLIYRQIESLDLARDILSSIMDAQLGIVSNRLNEIMRILTVISTIMMAASLVAGIYGMNFISMPGLSGPYGFYICLAGMVIVSAFILYLFKKKGFF